jgi:formiminotetrahydrofolate cyclodeaminase
MIKKSIQIFSEELSSSSPTPGGGSVAALMGAMAAALVSMVANLTVGKKKYADVEREVSILLKESEVLRQNLTDCIQKDISAFDSVMSVYSLPKNSDKEKNYRNQKMQVSLKEAIEAPLECAHLAMKVLPLAKRIAEIGNVNIISDAGVAALAARAALRSSALNVFVNASSLDDKDLGNTKISEIRDLINKSEQIEQEIFDEVSNVILGNKV